MLSDVEGYSEENYLVTKCRGDTCCRKRKLDVAKDTDVRKVGEDQIKKPTSIFFPINNIIPVPTAKPSKYKPT